MIYFLILLAIIIATPIVIEMRRLPIDDTLRQSSEGEFALLSQGITHYQWFGPVRGPVAVCIHGLTMPAFVWGGVARGLGLIGYRVLVYDLYGRGLSDRPKGPQDRAFFMQQLHDLLADQQIDDDITLIGYSMGGSIATCFAADNPNMVRQLILLAPAGMARSTNRLGDFIQNTAIIGDWLMLANFRSVQRKVVQSERAMPTSVPGIGDLVLNETRYRGYIPAILASLRGMLSETLKAEHETVHKAGIPVLAIWAREDKVIPLKAMGLLTEWSRDTRQEVIDGATHALPYTHTDQVLDTLRDALRDGIN